MQLLFILGVVLSFTALFDASDQPLEDPSSRVVLVGLAAFAVIAVAWYGGQLDRHATVKWKPLVPWVHRIHAAAYAGLLLVAFPLLGFAQLVRSQPRLGTVPLLDDLVVTTLLVAPLAISWYFLAVAECDTPTSRLRRVVLQLRHVVLLPLVPVLVLAGIKDLQVADAAGPSWGGFESAVAFAALLVFALTIPWTIRVCWPTRPLADGIRRHRVAQMLRLSGVRVADILLWETHGHMANAAISGFLPQLRYLFVTDELLRRTDLDELAAIAAHEAAHCRYGHLRTFVMSLSIPLLLMILAEIVSQRWGVSHVLGHSVTALVVLFGWGRAHGRLACHLEHQADVAACQLLSDADDLHPEVVGIYARALIATGANPQGDWLHPAPADRIALLRRLARQGESSVQAFHESVRAVRLRWTKLAIGLSVATLTLGILF